MTKIGYSLVEIASGQIIANPSGLPCRLDVAGVGVCDFDQPGQIMPDADAPTHKLVERVLSEPAPAQPATVSSETAVFDGGQVVVTRTYELLPVPPRMIEKSVVLQRLTDDQLASALSLMSARQKERWLMPGYPAISVEDPEMLTLIVAVGADPAIVLAVPK